LSTVSLHFRTSSTGSLIPCCSGTAWLLTASSCLYLGARIGPTLIHMEWVGAALSFLGDFAFYPVSCFPRVPNCEVRIGTSPCPLHFFFLRRNLVMLFLFFLSSLELCHVLFYSPDGFLTPLFQWGFFCTRTSPVKPAEHPLPPERPPDLCALCSSRCRARTSHPSF